MRHRPLQVIAVLLLLAAPASGCAQDRGLDAALDSLKTGNYAAARSMLQPHVGSDADSAGVATVGYLNTFLATGDYEAGRRAAEAMLASSPRNPFAVYMRGRFLQETGQLAAADSSYRRAASAKRNYWRNALDFAEMLYTTGKRGEAQRIFGTIASAYKQGYFKTAETLSIAGRSASFVGEFRDANNAFNTAYQLDPTNTQNLVWWADLFRDKYNNADADRTYEDALAINPNLADAYIGLALSTQSFAAKEDYADKALAANPRNATALAIKASMRILDGQYDEAESALNAALAINPASLDALAHLAAAQYLAGDTTAFRQTEMRAQEVTTVASRFYVTIAEDLALRFRYPDAVTISRKAVEASASDPQALAILGTSLLRMGDREGAKRYFERSFDRDRFNLFAGNTITLLNEYDDFATIESPHFSLLIHRDEADVLGAEIIREAESAYAAMSARYPYRPSGKISIEAYNDRDDFAVRIAGVPHLGLLGVSFGDVVAINTPRAQTGNEYNWARTLWHELAHTMAIGTSRNHVPRWFTEGLSVYEERLAHPEWGREMELELFAALDRDRLHPLENIDRGFTRPEFPGQVLLSYFHASKVIQYIAETYGSDAIARILTELGNGSSMDAAIQSATGESVAALDDSFMTSLRADRTNYAHLLEDLPDPLEENAADKLADVSSSRNEFLSELHAGSQALRSGDLDAAEAHYEKSIELYPTFVSAGNGYDGLAEVYRRRGDQQKLAETLERFLAVSDYGVEESVELAGIKKEADDLPDASALLERALFVDPYDANIRAELASLYGQIGDADGAIRNRRAVLALDPVDRADAYYQLAEALLAGGRTDEAKRATLQSLEIAPGFREAQRLLLRIVSRNQ